MNSKQIRPPIYSLKQSKLRKRRVVRFAILFFALLVLFIALLVGPIVAGNSLKGSDYLHGLDSTFILQQPGDYASWHMRTGHAVVNQTDILTISSITGTWINQHGAQPTAATTTTA